MASAFDLEVSRRKLLAAAGLLGGALAGQPLASGAAEAASPSSRSTASRSDRDTAAPVAGLHLQFGADASTEIAVSWHTLQPVRGPRVLVGHLDGRLVRTVEATARTYTNAKSGQVVHTYHARIGELQPDQAYLYAAMHDGAAPEFATFRTAPRGRAAFTFTSFGDQGDARPSAALSTPPDARRPLPRARSFVSDNLGTPAAGDTTLGVERVQPLFHLFNGDLCYANLAHDRVRAWWDFWDNNSRSAARRPWMPSPGNHENELGNGPIGYQAYQTYFDLPARRRPDRDDARPVVRLHRPAGARGRHRQRRCLLPGRRRFTMSAAIRTARRRPGWRPSLACRPRQSRRSTGSWSACTRWRSPRPTSPTAPISASAGVGAALRQVRRRPGGLRPRAPLRALASHPRRAGQRHPDADPRRDGHRRDRYDEGPVHMVLGGGGTSVPSNELLLPPAAVPGGHRRRGRRIRGHRQAAADLCAWKTCALVGGAQHRPRLRLRRLHRRSRIGRAAYRMRSPTTTWSATDGAIAPFESFTLRRPRRG